MVNISTETRRVIRFNLGYITLDEYTGTAYIELRDAHLRNPADVRELGQALIDLAAMMENGGA